MAKRRVDQRQNWRIRLATSLFRIDRRHRRPQGWLSRLPQDALWFNRLHYEPLEERSLLAAATLVSATHPDFWSASGDGSSAFDEVSMSADGRYTVFVSNSKDLVANVEIVPGIDHVYRYDSQTGEVVLVSVNKDGARSGNGNSSFPTISADGNVVAFVSVASDLHLLDTIGVVADVFVRNLATATTHLASLNSAGSGSGDQSSVAPVLNANGSVVAFYSFATNLHPLDTANNRDVYARNLTTGSTQLVSINSSGTGSGNDQSVLPRINSSGNLVAFSSTSSNLHPLDTNGSVSDAFVRNLTTGVTQLVSVNAAGSGAGNGASTGVALSADGSVVAFTSTANNLHPLDNTGSNSDVYARNLTTGVTHLVSVNSMLSSGGNGNSTSANLSGNGTVIAFSSRASNLHALDTNGAVEDVFVRNLATGTTHLASINSGGTGSGNGESAWPALNGNGTIVAFRSSATNLHALDTHSGRDVFARNLTSGITQLVSVNHSGTAGGSSESGVPVISSNGAAIGFHSSAANLVANDRNNQQDTFVRRLATPTVELASRRHPSMLPALTANGASSTGKRTVSADGRYVAFVSDATILVAGIEMVSGYSNVYRYDSWTGEIALVSVASNGTHSGNRASTRPTISADGSMIAFLSEASDLHPLDTSVGPDVFARNMITGATHLVSVNRFGARSAQGSDNPVISADGNVVVFESTASDLHALDTNGSRDVFARNLTTSTTHLVSLNSAGTGTGASSSTTPSVSADGQVVAFVSFSSLHPLDTNSSTDIYARNLSTGNLYLVSVNSAGTASGNGLSDMPEISANGLVVAFASSASNLHPLDTNGATSDVFARNLTTGTTTLVSSNSSNTGSGNQASWIPAINADGSVIAFLSWATNLHPLKTYSGITDVFARNLTTGVTQLVSVNRFGASASGGSNPVVSADGVVIAFTSTATDLHPLKASGSNTDVFARSLSTGMTQLVSLNHLGTRGGNNDSDAPAMSADGDVVAFQSLANDLVALDVNFTTDVFRFELASLVAEFQSGNVTIADTSADDNVLSLSVSGANLVIADAHEKFYAAPPGWSLASNGKSISRPLAGFSGNIALNTAGGNDRLTLDFSGGNPVTAGGVHFFGGSSTNSPGDVLAVTGGAPTSITHNLDIVHDGRIQIDGSQITYSETESVVDLLDAVNRTYAFADSADHVALGSGNDTGDGISRITGLNAGKTIDFATPSETLALRTAGGQDVITLLSVDTGDDPAANRGIVAEVESNNSLATAQNLDGADWNFSFNAHIGNGDSNTSLTVPHVSVQGAGDGTLDYFSFTVANAGDTAVFDVDFGFSSPVFIDTYLRLYNGSGTLLSWNDDALSAAWGQGGSNGIRDSYLEHTFNQPGVYYIQVGNWPDGAPVPAGATYQLQISLQNHPLATQTSPDVSDTEPNNSIATAQDVDQAGWNLSSNPNIGNATSNTSTLIPHLTIAGAGDGTFDYYRFTVVNAGDTAIFDVDFGFNSPVSIDPFLRLYNGSGTLLNWNDDAPSASWGQGGSNGTLDSYLEHTFTQPGVYYIQVGNWPEGTPVPAGATYQLQISLQNHPLTSLNPPEVLDSEPNNSSLAAQNVDRADWNLDANVNIGDSTSNTSTLIPHITIAGAGDGTLDYYSFTVAHSGDRAIFDVDFARGQAGEVDLYLRLFDSSGTLIDLNDDAWDASFGQGGSDSRLDPYLEHTFGAPGLYYIEVGTWPGGAVLPVGASYELQLSLENHALRLPLEVIIDSGDQDDQITVLPEISRLYATLTINGAAGSDTAAFSGNLLLDEDRNLTVAADTIHVVPHATISALGAGTIAFTADRNIALAGGAIVTTIDGNLTFSANQQLTPTAGNFAGIDLAGGTTQLLGAGSLSLRGRGGNSATGQQHGVWIQSQGSVRGGSSGKVFVEGTGGPSAGDANIGVYVAGSLARITSSGGDIEVIGAGGGQGIGSSDNSGVAVEFEGSIGRATFGPPATLTIWGVGGNAGENNSVNHGVRLGGAFSQISATGDLTVTGIAGGGLTSLALQQEPYNSIATTGGNLTLSGDRMQIAANAVISADAARRVTIKPYTAGREIDIGSSADPQQGALSLSSVELSSISAGAVQIGSADSGDITISSAVMHSTGSNFTLQSSGNITFQQAFRIGGSLSLQPGVSGSVRPLAVGNDVEAAQLTFAPGTRLSIAVNGPAVDTQYSQLNVRGTIDLAGVTLVTTGSYRPLLGEAIVLVENDGVDDIVGTFAGLNQGAIAVVNGASVPISYLGNSGNDAVLLNSQLQVFAVTPTASGFVAELNGPLETSVFNLYDQDGAFGEPDVTLVDGAQQRVRGSIVVDSSRRKLTFIKSGDNLSSGNYTVTLKSGVNALRNPSGLLLDGDGDGSAGGNHVGNFTISASANAIALSVPDFVRGLGQTIHLPASTSTGIPITISSAQAIASASLTLNYDPALLTISAAAVGSGIAGSVSIDTSTAGVARIHVTSSGQLSAAPGPQVLVRLTAAVPAAAAYAASHVLDLTDLRILHTSAAELPAIDEDGIHIAAFFGDANGSQSYNAPDATATQRIIVGSNSGLAPYPLADPYLVVDINGNNQVQSDDVTQIQRAIVGLSAPNIPSLPGFSPAVAGESNPGDSIPKSLAPSQGETATVPDNSLVTETSGVELAATDLALADDASTLQLNDIDVGELSIGFGLNNNAIIAGCSLQSLMSPARDLPPSSNTLQSALYDVAGDSLTQSPATTNASAVAIDDLFASLESQLSEVDFNCTAVDIALVDKYDCTAALIAEWVLLGRMGATTSTARTG